MSTTLLESLAKATAADCGTALTRYYELLTRHDNATPADTKALREVMTTLQLSSDDVAGDVRALREMRREQRNILSDEQLVRHESDLDTARDTFHSGLRSLMVEIIGNLPGDQLIGAADWLITSRLDMNNASKVPPEQERRNALATAMMQADMTAADALRAHRETLRQLDVVRQINPRAAVAFDNELAMELELNATE